MPSINVASPVMLYRETLTLLERLSTLQCSNEDDCSLKQILISKFWLFAVLIFLNVVGQKL